MDERLAKWDIRFLKMCQLVSTWSKDPSTKVGAAIVDTDNRIVSIGFNGYPTGVKDDNSLNIREEKYKKVVHGELNCLLFANTKVKGYTIYVYPLPPCSQCASAIIQSGIKRVVTLLPEGELKERWKESNSIAESMFLDSGVDLVYLELTC